MRFPPVIPRGFVNGCQVYSYSWVSGGAGDCGVMQMEIRCSRRVHFALSSSFGWILMRRPADESHARSCAAMPVEAPPPPPRPPHHHHHPPGRSVSGTAELNLWLTINQKQPKQWRRGQRSVTAGKKKNSPDSSPGQQSGPAFISLRALSLPKNSLISNGLIRRFQYGPRMFSLMAFPTLFYRARL